MAEGVCWYLVGADFSCPCPCAHERLEDGWPESIFYDTQPESVHFFHLCISLSTLCMPLCISLPTFPAHASMHFTLAFCRPLFISVSAFPAHAPMHFTLLSLHMPLCISVCFSCACIYALHSVLALRVPLCISLSTFSVHASMHLPQYLPSACLYAFHCLLSLRMPV